MSTDTLKKPDTFHTDGTATGIAMRATEKGRADSLIAMVQGDRRDVRVMEAMRKIRFGGPGWWIDRNGMAIVDARLSDCGRFEVNPFDAYGLTEFEANLLSNLNDGLEE